MSRRMKPAISAAVLLAAVVMLGPAKGPGAFSSYVDAKGSISLPSDLRTAWSHLGSWVVTSPLTPGSGLEQTAPGQGIHNVYTQPESLKAYRKTSAWPDGTMLVMEVRAIQWDDLPTGHVMTEGGALKWLIMVRDSTGRFPKNPNWGEGWGWALFHASDPKKNASTNYKNDCLDCHDLVKAANWVFLSGYPTLR